MFGLPQMSSCIPLHGGWLSKAILETLGNRLGQLEDEIKKDEAGKVELDRMLAQVWIIP